MTIDPEELECPCCGDDGAESDADGFFHDGQPLVCGCPGWVSVDEGDAWINNGDDPCKKCVLDTKLTDEIIDDVLDKAAGVAREVQQQLKSCEGIPANLSGLRIRSTKDGGS